MKSKNLVLLDKEEFKELDSKYNLVHTGTMVSIQGDDRERLKLLFSKTLKGQIQLNELKMMAAFLTAICQAADLQK